MTTETTFRGVDFNQANRDAWVASMARSLPAGTRILDIGAGQCPYRSLFAHCRYEAHDFAGYSGTASGPMQDDWRYGRLDYVSDAASIPVPDEAFDAVLCTEVMEHVPDPMAVLREIGRLLRPGGQVFLTAPLGSGLHQEPFHFYGGFTPMFYEHTLALCGFTDISVVPNGGLLSHTAQELHRVQTVLDRAIGSDPQWQETRRAIEGLVPWLLAAERQHPYPEFAIGFHVRARKAGLNEPVGLRETAKVDVIIPVFNGRNYLEDAIRSVARQTIPAHQILVVDDGSTDGSGDLAESLAEVVRPARLRVIRKPNGGLSSARNAGLRASTSEFVAFLDADDVWLERKLERQLEVLRTQPEVGAVYCGYENMDPAGRPLTMRTFRLDPSVEGDIRERLFAGNLVAGSGSAVVIRREVALQTGFFDEGLTSSEDWDYWLRAAALTRFGLVAEPLVRLRRHQESMQSTGEERLLANDLRVLAKQLEHGAPKHTIRRSAARRLMGSRPKFALRQLRLEDVRSAEAIRTLWDPTSRIALGAAVRVTQAGRFALGNAWLMARRVRHRRWNLEDRR